MWQISVSDLSAAGSSAQGIPSAGVPVPGVGSGGGLSPPPPGVQLLIDKACIYMFFLLVLECLIVMMISPDKALADVNFKSVLLDVNALLESATSSVPPTVTVAVQLFASFVLHVNPTDWTFSV